MTPMSEVTSFNPRALHQPQNPRTHGVKAAPAPKGYRESEDVVMRAGVLSDKESPENIRALKRLDHALSADQPLRGDVPRGFYLNLRV